MPQIMDVHYENNYFVFTPRRKGHTTDGFRVQLKNVPYVSGLVLHVGERHEKPSFIIIKEEWASHLKDGVEKLANWIGGELGAKPSFNVEARAALNTWA